MDQEIKQILEFASSNPFAKMLNIEFKELEEGQGRACIEMTVSPEHLNPYGTLHGGVISSLADIAMGVAIRTLGKTGVTVNLNTNFLAPGKLGERITVQGKVVHDGNSLVSTECMIANEDDLLARASGLWFILK